MKRNRTKNSGKFVGLVAGALAAMLTFGASAATYHVDGVTGSDNNDGLFWSTPFKTVRKALFEADQNPGPHEIWVVSATYYPDEINGTDSDDRADTFSLVNGVKLYGGFLNGDDFEDRDPENNITILSGDIDQDGFSDSDNSYHVVSAISLSSAVINGFTIEMGRALGAQLGGGGMLVDDAAPHVIRCIFTRNVGLTGGAMRIVDTPGANGQLILVNCSFIDNSANEGGGGVYCLRSEPIFINCLFNANKSPFHRGGGMWIDDDSALQVINCSFTANEALVENGGGIYNDGFPAHCD